MGPSLRGHLLRDVLLIQGDLRALGSLHRSGGAERSPVQSSTASAVKEAEPLQREQKIGMPQTTGFQLHHADADRRGDSFPHRGDSSRGRHHSSHNLV